MSSAVLQIRDLRVAYHTDSGPVKAVDGVTLDVHPGERLGIVGESGSGKSTMALAIMRLIKPPGRIEGGQILLDGRDLTQLSEEDIRRVRMREISMIPQGAMNSLNPVMRIKDQLIDGMRAHGEQGSDAVLARRAAEVLESVGLPRAAADMFPHQLSGGMKQRVCIAIAIALRPKIIIADEPTSALDVVTQRQVMETIGQVQQRLGSSVVLIGHDMGLMAQFVDRLAVMYAGRLVEVGPIRESFKEPLHPYTQLLISTLPVLGAKGVFKGIPGLPPSLRDVPPGCVFHPRYPKVMEVCTREIPLLQEARPGRLVACHLYQAQPPDGHPVDGQDEAKQ